MPKCQKKRNVRRMSTFECWGYGVKIDGATGSLPLPNSTFHHLSIILSIKNMHAWDVCMLLMQPISTIRCMFLSVGRSIYSQASCSYCSISLIEQPKPSGIVSSDLILTIQRRFWERESETNRNRNNQTWIAICKLDQLKQNWVVFGVETVGKNASSMNIIQMRCSVTVPSIRIYIPFSP